MRKLDFFRLQAPAAVPAHIGASSLKKSNFLIFSKVLRKGADQAKYFNNYRVTDYENTFSAKKQSFLGTLSVHCKIACLDIFTP